MSNHVPERDTEAIRVPRSNTVCSSVAIAQWTVPAGAGKETT